MFFTERLALLLETGGSLHPSLLELSKQTDNQSLAAMLQSMASEVESGKAFSEALAKHPQTFSSTYVNLVRASEQGGFMHKVLLELKEMEAKKEKLRSTIVSALSYPLFLLFFSVSVIIFILIFVFPKFGDLFTSIHDQLPPTTLCLMFLSDILRYHWYLVAAFFGILFFFTSHWMHSEKGVAVLDRWKLSIPLLKKVVIEVYLVHLLRVMSLSLANGVSVVDALHSCRDVIDNRFFRGHMTYIEEMVNEGKGIAAGFNKMSYLPSLARQMIMTGEETGNLALVMGRIADFYEGEIEKKIASFSRIIEPLMLLFMGLVVGIIVSSLILPIFKLSRAVH